MNAKTEQRILQSIAANVSHKHRNEIIADVGRSYYTVLKYLRDLRYRGLVETKSGPTWEYEEWWSLTDNGKAHLQEGQT